jgi:secreted trypsin-like serine protease
MICGKKPQDRYLVGIVSFGGPMYCANDMPGVYTHVAAFRPWIDEKIAETQIIEEIIIH